MARRKDIDRKKTGAPDSTSLAGRLRGLSRRERIMLIGGAIFVSLFVLHQAVIEPFMLKKQRLERSLQRRAEAVLEMKLLQKQYAKIRGNERDAMERLQRRDPGFELFSFIDSQVSAQRLRDRVSSMKPGEAQSGDGITQSRIDMKIDSILLGQLVDFLVAIESFEHVVYVDRIVVRSSSSSGGEDGLLDVLATVSTFELDGAR